MSDAPDESGLIDVEDPEQLRAYLTGSGRLAPGEIREISPLGGGVSNRTVRVVRTDGENWILKQALANLRVPADWYSPRERIYREAAGLRWLAGVLPGGAVPTFLFEDRDQFLFAMSEVPEPRKNWKEMLLGGELRPAHVEEAAALLAAIHRVGADPSAAAPELPDGESETDRAGSGSRRAIAPHAPGIPDLFLDRTSVETLRLRPYYEYAAERVEEAGPFLRALVEETRVRSEAVVHGDFSPKNLLVRPDRMVLLDHEVIHVGDPALDTGFFLTHLLSKAHHVRALRAEFVEAARRFWSVYRSELVEPGVERAGSSRGATVLRADDLEERAARHLAGCLLARAAGKSCLEYLTEEARERQVEAVLVVLAEEPRGIAEFAGAFHRALESRDPTE